MTLGFVRETVGVEGEIEVRLNSERPEMDAVMRGWLADQEGLVPAAETVGTPCGPATVVNRLGAARLAPALAVVSGELR
jgi:ribosomal 30S subunit maturation factor RimM